MKSTPPDEKFGLRHFFTVILFMAAAVLALSLLSNFNWHPPFSSTGFLKFTVKELPPFLEPELSITPQEIEILPFHMRPKGRAELGGKRLSISIELFIDGNSYIAKVYRPGSLRQDGWVHVLKEIKLSPGQHDLLVKLKYLPSEEDHMEFRNILFLRAGEVKVLEIYSGSIRVK